jgi:valyl-tRNA synthetase
MLSSSLIPIVIAGWPEKELHENVLDLMETGHDIVYVFFGKFTQVDIAQLP